MVLNALMQKYGTDKGTPGNGYALFYESLFGATRLSTRSVLEIGIHKGASLLVWREWFPLAQIVGVDCNPVSIQDYGERIIALHGNVRDPAFLTDLATRYMELDIVIDDGSHQFADQLPAFNALFPCVSPGGWYIIEDAFLTTRHNGETGKIFYAMCDITRDANRYCQSVFPANCHPHAKDIFSVTFFDSLIAIQKR